MNNKISIYSYVSQGLGVRVACFSPMDQDPEPLEKKHELKPLKKIPWRRRRTEYAASVQAPRR